MEFRRWGSLALLLVGCGLPLQPNQRVPTFPLYDPESGEIPMPNDALRDAAAGRLDLPLDDEGLTDADRDFRRWLNTRDGWASTMPATVRFSGPIDSRTVDEDNVQIWDWNDGDAHRVEDARMVVDEDDRRLRLIPPRTGWTRGHTYVVVLVGGEGGVRDAQGFGLEPDAIFYFLKRTQRLDTVGHNRAFPGSTRAERLENGRRLEALRVELMPFFEFFEDPARPRESEISREDVAALWSFTVTGAPELAMDRDSQRVPVPFDLLIDPDTGLVALEDAEWDTELEVHAKHQLNELRGFGLSANLHWEATEALDPTSLPERVHVFELGAGLRELPARVRVLGEHGEAPCAESPTPVDCTHVIVEIDDSELPLRPSTQYAVVVDRGALAASGEELEAMPIGYFLRSASPLSVNGRSQLSSLSDELAGRLERTRERVADLLDAYGREHVVTAWPFFTMDAEPEMREIARTTTALGVDVTPVVRERREPREALRALFPGIEASLIRLLYLPRTQGVEEFVIGTLPNPSFLDPVTRRWREDGSHEIEGLPFYLSIPEDVDASEPLPVVIFGHATATDQRFMMTVAGEFARRGFATLAIDFPYHGERAVCIDRSLIGLPNFFPDPIRDLTGLEDDILRFPPCASGSDATCSPEGRCVTADGQPDEFTALPLVSVEVVSGAAFLDVGDLPYIKDHFNQALVDLSTVLESILADVWERAVGVRLDPDNMHYAGQSLGAIIGAVWVSVTPEIKSAVLNVPGSDLVDLFAESTYFSPQIDAYFDELGVANPSYEKERLLDTARWLIDSVDPHSVAHRLAEEDRRVLLQMDRGDIIIPNRTTEVLRRVSDRPMRTYPSPLHGDLIIPVVGDDQLSHMGQFLSGEIDE